MFDVVIIGGGPAGLSAGLVLGRFGHQVLICDSQRPRNAKSPAVHAFLSRDGVQPQELLSVSRAQLSAYPSVEIRNQEVMDVAREGKNFIVTLQEGAPVTARKILFATGVKDILPSIAGVDALFGKSVFHCPYCHGWEARGKTLAILANGASALHLTMLVHRLNSDIVICTNGPSEISAEDQRSLDRHGIQVIETPIERLQWHEDVLEAIVFKDGIQLPREALMVRTTLEQHSSLPVRLGCALNEMGFLAVDDKGHTSVEGVFAAGDITSMAHQVIFAASRGAFAATWINTELLHEAFLSE